MLKRGRIEHERHEIDQPVLKSARIEHREHKNCEFVLKKGQNPHGGGENEESVREKGGKSHGWRGWRAELTQGQESNRSQKLNHGQE